MARFGVKARVRARLDLRLGLGLGSGLWLGLGLGPGSIQASRYYFTTDCNVDPSE